MHNKVMYFLYVLLLGLLGVLLHEYYYLRQQQKQLHDLQYEYQRYLAYYKQALSKYTQEQAAQEIIDAQEGGTHEFFFAQNPEREGKEFLVVNRELPYLKEEALQFGKQHKMEPAIQQLYDPETSQQKKSSSLKNRPQGRRLRAGESYYASLAKDEAVSKMSKKLHWPIDREQFWLSSKFGPRKKKGGGRGFHYGIDMAALKGTLVKAALQGVVVEAGNSPHGYGKCIVIHHAAEKIATRYAHLDSMLVKIGDNVKAGDGIGRVGNTGFVWGKNGDSAKATHLHFEVMLAGKKRIDPLLLLT